MKTWLKSVKSSWSLLVSAAVVVTAALSGFLVQPPPESAGTGNVYASFGRFLIAIIIGLLAVQAWRYSTQRRTMAWWLVTLGSTVTAVGVFILYQDVRSENLVPCQGSPVYIGTQLTAHGSEYVRGNPNVDHQTMLDEHNCRATDIWTEASIESGRRVVSAVYLVCIFLLTLSMVSITQAISCATQKPKSDAVPVSL